MEGPGNFRDTKPAATRSDVRRIIRYTISVLACILLVVISVVGYNFYKLSSTGVFNAQYRPYGLPIAKENASSRALVETEYLEKHFDGVVAMAKHSNDTLTLLLAGMSALELKNYMRAIEYFKKVIETNEKAGTRRLKDESEYYLALAYIAEKDFDLSLDLLQKIYEDESHLYHEEVTRKLLRQVRLLKWR